MNKLLKHKITKPMIVGFVIFVILIMTAFIGFLLSVNQWYHYGQRNFIYNYISLFYGIVLSILWLLASIFTQVVSEGKFNNDEFFIKTLEVFMVLFVVSIFGLFFLGRIKSLL